MKHTLLALLVVGGVVAVSHEAMAAFVFNPTLTMHHRTHHSPPPRVAKAAISNAVKQQTRQQAKDNEVEKVDIKNFAFPLFGMNK